MTVTSNKYSDKKIVWFPEKLQSFVDNKVISPIYVRIKPLNACNHHCFWCVYHSDLTFMHGKMNAKDMLPSEKFHETLESIKDLGVKCVTYSGGGEPLLYPKIETFLQKTLDLGLDLSIITHGQFLVGAKADILSQSSWVRVSMDYFDGPSIKKSRGVKEEVFSTVIKNLKEFAAKKNSSCDLSINYIITQENYLNLMDITKALVDTGVNNIRFSPMWCDNFHEYHNNIKTTVFNSLEECQKLETETFKVYSSYRQVEDKNISNRLYPKCYINQVVPVVGADQKIYVCHNQAYSENSAVGSIKDKSFKDVWLSEETQKFFDAFNCQKTCTGQCAADSKNKFITELLEAKGDNFV